MAATYIINDAGTAITCWLCGLTSHNPNDVAQRFCGHCHFFHDDMASFARVAAQVALIVERPLSIERGIARLEELLGAVQGQEVDVLLAIAAVAIVTASALVQLKRKESLDGKAKAAGERGVPPAANGSAP